MPANYAVLLLDMNGTFMFGQDRFGPDEDYARTYRALRGQASLSDAEVNAAIRASYAYLDVRYADPAHHEAFPTVMDVLNALPATRTLPHDERARLERTFALHECGHIPPAYAEALRRLARHHRLALVADIWADKAPWLDTLEDAEVAHAFEVMIFSSDYRTVKPSPLNFQRALAACGAQPGEAVVIGDSVRRDLGGAVHAGLDCILVGGATAPEALATVPDLLALASPYSA